MFEHTSATETRCSRLTLVKLGPVFVCKAVALHTSLVTSVILHILVLQVCVYVYGYESDKDVNVQRFFVVVADSNHRRQRDVRIRTGPTDEVMTDELDSIASCQGATRRSVCLSGKGGMRERESESTPERGREGARGLQCQSANEEVGLWLKRKLGWLKE